MLAQKHITSNRKKNTGKNTNNDHKLITICQNKPQHYCLPEFLTMDPFIVLVTKRHERAKVTQEIGNKYK